jgi:hypothetical protein
VLGCGLTAPDFQRDTVAFETAAMFAISVPLRPPSSFSSSMKRGTAPVFVLMVGVLSQFDYGRQSAKLAPWYPRETARLALTAESLVVGQFDWVRRVGRDGSCQWAQLSPLWVDLRLSASRSIGQGTDVRVTARSGRYRNGRSRCGWRDTGHCLSAGGDTLSTQKQVVPKRGGRVVASAIVVDDPEQTFSDAARDYCYTPRGVVSAEGQIVPLST